MHTREATPRGAFELPFVDRCIWIRIPKLTLGNVEATTSPSDYPRAYICHECVAVCASIIEDERLDSDRHGPFLNNPMLSEFLDAAEKWIACESNGQDATAAILQMRAVASLLFATSV